MAYIIEVPNSFDPMKDLQKHVHPGGISIREWLLLRHGLDFVEFPVPTICIINGMPVKRERWNEIIQPADVVNFVAVPSGPFLIIAIIIIAVIVIVALTMNVPKPVTPGELPASDPVFSTKGQQNSIRLGEPIEVCYGRNRIYPSLASRPYFQYINNDQFQYALMVIGQGYYDVEAVQIGDTPISNYAEVEYAIVQPGDPVTLFPTDVITSVEAGGQELIAPNQIEYVAPGWVGPFLTNAPTKQTNKIQVDLIFPKGEYSLNDDGGVSQLTTSVEIQARLVDDAGAPLSAYFDLPSPTPYTFSAATTTPQRRTLSFDVVAGRYEVRVRRTDNKDETSRAGHDVIWEGMRAFLTETTTFDGLTLLAVKIRATNNLNNKSNLLFNVVATRKLPVYNSEGGPGVLTTTRSIVWAFIDVFKSVYGGRIFDDVFIDWDGLEALDSFYAARGDHFDWVFRDPITVWEAAATVSRAGRAVPLLIGSLITMKRDGPLSIPVTFFSPENIIKDTFNWQIKLWDIDEFDSVRIEYTEPATGYKQETVVTSLPGGTTDNPEDIRLSGVQSRQQAYNEGLFLCAQRRYLRENFTFETGMEGHIPTFGDLIAVSHDVPRWGQSGYVVNAELESSTGEWRLWLSEPLTFTASEGIHQLVLRGKKSEWIGPFTVTQTIDTKQVLITIPEEYLDSNGEFDFLLDGKTEPMLFLFGIAGSITKYAKVVAVEPQGGEVVRISGVNYAPVIHSFDGLTPPTLTSPPTAPVSPDLPTVAHVYLAQISGPNQIIQVSWTAAFGAQYYVVQLSSDNVNWQETINTFQTSLQFQVRSGSFYVRVAGVNNGQGAWATASLVITPPQDDTELYDTQAGLKVFDLTASDYTLIQDIDNALGAVFNGTASTGDTLLARPTDNALGDLI